MLSPDKNFDETRARHLDISGAPGLWAFLIGAGIFATTLPQSGSLSLPLRNLLEGRFHAPLPAISLFFGIAAAPWYCKIVVGLLSDSVPLFGTTRRHYVLLSATAAGALWLLAGHMQQSCLSLLIAITAMEAMLVLGSTVVGGILVEAGQRLANAGWLVAARIVVESLCAVIAGPLAGLLAGLPFATAAAVGGLIAFSMAPIAFIWLKEPATARYEVSATAGAWRELRAILASRPLWIAVGFIFIASIPQAFPTPLWHYQKTVLRFSDTTIGYLLGAGGAGSVVAAIAYGFIYRHVPLRLLLAAGIVCSAFGSLAYVFYHSLPAAVAIDSANGLLTTLWILAMMETAVWATPGHSAAAGFALLMGATNAGSALGDYVAADLMQWGVLELFGIAVLSTVLTALMAAFVPLLPRSLFGPRRG